MSRVLKIAGILVVVAVCGAVGFWGTGELLSQEGDAEGESQGGGPRATRVTVAAPEMTTVEDSFAAVGTILPVRSIELRPLAQGRVVEIGVDSGEAVERGDLIFRLDDRAARAALADAEATLRETRAEFERIQELASEDVAAEARLETARGAYRRAQAAVDEATAVLEDRSLTAPFAGVVGIIDMDPGEYVDSATDVSTLDDLSSVQADFALPERYFERAEAGQKVRVTSAIYPGRTFEGEVSVKAPRIDAASRSFAARVRMDNADRLLASGMFVTAELIFQTYEAPTLPDDAIISEGDATYVYIVEDGTARRTEVSVAPAEGGRTEITEGLPDEARVVTTGWDTLSDGAPVEVAEDPAPEEALN